jgi:hypothetical protein|tara:strand:+ start:127 stop:276 length:150 start_codon:yes stop_codon:yes gene_type:complete
MRELDEGIAAPRPRTRHSELDPDFWATADYLLIGERGAAESPLAIHVVF